MTLIAGIDSSTQSCKITVRDLETGREIREGQAGHPDATIVSPSVWWDALLTAVRRAGGLNDVSAISVSGQQHTPIFLDAEGGPICDSPLWNDVGSHSHTADLNNELGADEWIRRTGLPITLSDTVSKLRWLRDTNPAAARRTEAVAIVHDWLIWRLRGFGGQRRGGLDELTTDRSEASGTGYWSGEDEAYCTDLFELAFSKSAVLPRILAPLDVAGVTGAGLPGIPAGIPIAVGSGDNAAAAIALGVSDGDVVLSMGTSGVVYTRTPRPVHDYAGYVCSYADATGSHLPLVATLNSARNFKAATGLLGCSFDELAELALQAPPGAEGLTVLPYFEGERTPNAPDARASLHGASLANFTRPNVARAMVEGTLASQTFMLDALRDCGVESRRLMLIGGAAQNSAVRRILPQLVDMPIAVPAADEYVAKGAAMHATAALTGEFPLWSVDAIELPAAASQPRIAAQHEAVKTAFGYAGAGSEIV